MEKIAALIDKLQELKSNNAALSDLAYYTQLLYAELMCAKGNVEREKSAGRKKVAVIMPGYQSSASSEATEPKVEEQKQQVKQPVPEPAIPEREEATEREEVIKEEVIKKVEDVPAPAPAPKPQPEPVAPVAAKREDPVPPTPKTLFDLTDEPAPSYRRNPVNANGQSRELNDVMAEKVNTPSLNDRLKTEKIDLASKLNGSAPINDLSKAIDINDKFLFINELFRGDRDMYDRSIKTINGCNNLETAEYWIERELKIKLGWQEKDSAVQQFYHLIRKRFMAA